jgi:phosphatidylglycerophosphate synthase
MKHNGVKLLDNSRDYVRAQMDKVARVLDKQSRGSIKPNHITYTGLLMHIPIGLLIAVGSFYWAAVLLIIFGLFDALDGALARVQKRDSAAGMLLDASTDRIKEIFLYVGAAYYSVMLAAPIGAVWAVAACGASLCVSYVKAKGETAVRDTTLSPSQVNRLFADGIMRFEVRMAVLVIGLLLGQLLAALVVITILSTYTTFDRLLRIQRKITPQP